MKKLFALILATAGAAHAGDIASLPNQSGGAIVLTDIKCGAKEVPPPSWRAYTSGGPQYSMGCYFVSETSVHVLWSQPFVNYQIYPANSFTVVPKK